MNRYEARINLHGNNYRDRQINILKQRYLKDLPNNPSYKNVKINGVDDNLIINTGEKPYYKEFETLPNHTINIGDYVDFADQKWLVINRDYDDELYIDGKMTQCNYELKWQNEKGEIITRPAIISSASKYNDGTDGNAIIVLGSDQLSVIIPVDDESKKINKSMEKKFFIDHYPLTKDSTVYILTGSGNVPDTYDGHGVTSWIVKETQYSPTDDDLKYGVCEYFNPTTPTQPDKTTILCDISGGDELNYRLKNKFVAKFKDSDIVCTFNIVSDLDITQTVGDNCITLLDENEDDIGKTFELQVLVNGDIVASKTIKIVDML